MATPTVDDDFDAWYDETVKPYRFKLLGKVWELPGAVPATTVLRYQKLLQVILALRDVPDDVEPDLPEGFTQADLSYESTIRELAGDAMVDEWFALGLTEPHLAKVSQRLVAKYIVSAGDPVGKAPAQPQDRRPPAKKRASTARSSPRASSSTGRPSKPTGKRSTTATSPTT